MSGPRWPGCGLDAEAVERLAAESFERMERDDVHNDIYTRSFDEIAAEVCRDLGLKIADASPPRQRERLPRLEPLKF